MRVVQRICLCILLTWYFFEGVYGVVIGRANYLPPVQLRPLVLVPRPVQLVRHPVMVGRALLVQGGPRSAVGVQGRFGLRQPVMIHYPADTPRTVEPLGRQRPSYQQYQGSMARRQRTSTSRESGSGYRVPQSSRNTRRGGYGRKKQKIYIPVPIRRKKKKKRKLVAINPGFYIPGGSQVFGKSLSLNKCMHLCEATATCFAGDYDPWLKRCYFHGNQTACNILQAHPKLKHFKKVPCEVPGAQEGLITLGANLANGVLVKGVDSLSGCIKLCVTEGRIPVSKDDLAQQTCFGLDYDFASHKCYIHVDNRNLRLCPDTGLPPTTPRDLTPNAAVVNIILCPGP